ncbi:MAG: Nif3-like dinuclear metal center hexameric protein [Methylobacter sp.]
MASNPISSHHGLFWTFHGAKPLTGAFAKRIFPLVKNDINLFAYHLPLDGHPDIGNAAMLGQPDRLRATAAFRRLQRLGDRH